MPTLEETQAAWLRRGFMQMSMIPLLEQETPQPRPPRRKRKGPTIPEAVAYGRMWTIKAMPADGPPHLWKTTASVNNLVRTNTRLAVCFAVAEGTLTELQGASYLGLDARTFAEIYAAAQRWATDIKEGLPTDGAVAPQPEPR